MLKKESRIYIAGHKGLVGSSVLKLLKKGGYKNLFFNDSKSLDLRKQEDTFNYLKKIKPEFVIICAARVGGIKANNIRRAEFLYDNLSIQNNLIHGSFTAHVKNLIFLGSSCIYPRLANQPIKEKSILSGYLEYTNEPYAIAKIAGLKLCENYNFQYKTNYKCIMPSNIFGPGDNYDLNSSHFLPAIIKKIYLSKLQKKKKIYFWGTGKAKREVTYVDDISSAILFFLKKKTKESLINVGSGYENTIRGYINLILKRMNYKAEIHFDNNKEIDGTPRKILDSSLAHKYGFFTKLNFLEGLDLTLKDFLNKKEFDKIGCGAWI
jgi:GDP-L-fucose synthase